MSAESILFALTAISTLCWPICFWWMHRISARQDAMLKELHEQGRRIEKVSRAEHDLLEDLHPQVGQIQKKIGEVADELQNS